MASRVNIILNSKWGLIYLIILSLFLNECFGNENTKDYCSALNNMRWRRSGNGKCVKCENCPPGNFRNLTEKYEGRKNEYGDLECLPCRECPAGTYSKDGAGECILCAVNCTALYREYDQTCTRTQDAKCGSCNSGFVDIYSNSNFPCGPKSSIGKQLAMEVSEHSKEDVIIGSEKELTNTESGSVSTPGNIILFASLVTVGIVIVVTGVVCFVKFRRPRRTGHTGQSTDIKNCGDSSDNLLHSDKLLNLSMDNGIDIDGPTKDTNIVVDVEKLVYQPLKQTDQVRPELGSDHIPEPRAELSQTNTLEYPSQFIYIRYPASDIWHLMECYRDNKNICECQRGPCSCGNYFIEMEDILVQESDVYILECAANICHDPIPLFRALCLDNSVIYQENDSRDRDPERIPLKELVTRLLNIWIQRSKTPAKLNVLLKALCKTKYHHICQKIKNIREQNVQVSVPREQTDRINFLGEQNNDTLLHSRSNSVSLFNPSVQFCNQ